MDRIPVDKVKSKVFKPVGRCIYCSAQPETGLSREHIIPIGLGGGLILPAASCESCRTITGQFEAKCLRTNFLSHRIHQQLVRHPDEIPNSEKAKPPRLLSPEFHGPPGILINRSITAPFCIVYLFAAQRKDMEQMDMSDEFSNLAFDLDSHIRMLAKIAHSFAVAHIGIEEFDPLLLDLIFARRLDTGSYFIGESTEIVPIIENQQHQIGLQFGLHNEKWIVAVRIRIFAGDLAPPCVVIAGYLKNPRSETLARFGLP